MKSVEEPFLCRRDMYTIINLKNRRYKFSSSAEDEREREIVREKLG